MTGVDSSVSVVLGTYNGSRHIEQQLSSLLGQTMTPLEILVCDDGSTDDTLAIVERLAAGSSVPVRVVRNAEQLGFADNFLHGAELASGRFVAFCDQDDVWSPHKLAVAVEGILQHHAVMAAHTVRLIDESGEGVGEDRQGINAERVVEPLTEGPWRKFFGFTLVVERALLAALPRETRGADTHAPDKPLSHDRWACFLGFSLGRVVLLDAQLAEYRQHSSQLYGSGDRSTNRLRRERDRLSHLIGSVASVGERNRFLARVCADRASALTSADWPDESASARAAAHWCRLAEAYRQREALHAPRSLHSRLRVLTSLLRAGVYRSTRAGGLTGRALVQDIWFLLVPQRV